MQKCTSRGRLSLFQRDQLPRGDWFLNVIAHFGDTVVSPPVNISTQSKQCERRLHKVITVNVPLHTQLQL
jgi:hypothetical protein